MARAKSKTQRKRKLQLRESQRRRREKMKLEQKTFLQVVLSKTSQQALRQLSSHRRLAVHACATRIIEEALVAAGLLSPQTPVAHPPESVESASEVPFPAASEETHASQAHTAWVSSTDPEEAQSNLPQSTPSPALAVRSEGEMSTKTPEQPMLFGF